LAPPMHLFPPQTVAPTAVQSALEAQGVAAALSHVSQKHRGAWHTPPGHSVSAEHEAKLLVPPIQTVDTKPGARHAGLDVDMVAVSVPVVLAKSMGSVANTAPA